MPDKSLLTTDRRHVVHSLHHAPTCDQAHIWTGGRGAMLYDENGREFFDALAGLWNVVVGHGRSELAAAASRQMNALAYATCYAGSTNRPAIELAEKLSAIFYPSINRFFFTCGGAEANEAAFKTARFFWKVAGMLDKTKIIGRTWGYHGTTLAAMSATGLPSYWPWFEPRVPGFLHIESPYPYRFVLPITAANDPRTPGQLAADLLEEAIVREGPDSVAAFLGEPIQCVAGVIVPPDDYWPRIREICDRHNVLLIADEVITGFGRTGDWFALSRYGIEPDLVTFAKGITSGYFPLGGLGVSDRIAAAIDEPNTSRAWMHAHTYSAHPVGCAVALANLDILEREGLVERAGELGRYLNRQAATLASHKNVGEVRGLGLMTAVEIVADRETKAEFPPEERIGPRIHEATQRRGMFTRMRGDVYNIAPCYKVEERQIDRMIEILGESIAEVLG
ncbi:MAG: aspartate aminotransferase family protein [Planctomycetota bacterium]|nr:MAG: aspartate aminotransferase family protein [Planctomycetota bacterium]